MNWIYILKCNNNNFYVGETTRLFRRLREHTIGKATDFTKNNKPYKLCAIYKLANSENQVNEFLEDTFSEYDFLEDNNKKLSLKLENEITLMLMKILDNNWKNVYGGKFNKNFLPEKNPSSNLHLNRPFCKCNLPSDLNEYKSKKYWRCSKKNFWDELKEFIRKDLNFPIEEACNFYRIYKENDNFQIFENKKKENKNYYTIDNSYWLKNIPNIDNKLEYNFCVSCDFNMRSKKNIIYFDEQKSLCTNCFYNNYKKLSQKYKDKFLFKNY